MDTFTTLFFYYYYKFTFFILTSIFSIFITGVWITCLGASLLSALFDLGSLAEMISIGTLLAFSCICLGVLVLRYGKEDMNSITEGTSIFHIFQIFS